MTAWLAPAASILGGLLGRQKPTETKWVTPDYKEIRREAQKAGFNPLTALTSAPGGLGTSTPGGLPLASIELLTGGLREVGDILSGKAAQDAARERLQTDLMALQLDQARSGVVAYVPRPPVVDAGAGLGARTTIVAPITSRRVPVASSEAVMPVDPVTGREVEQMPTPDSGGFMRMTAPAIGVDEPVYIPGDSEPWGIDELSTAVIVGAPQVIRQREMLPGPLQDGLDYMADQVMKPAPITYDGANPFDGRTPAQEVPAGWVRPEDRKHAGYGGWR